MKFVTMAVALFLGGSAEALAQYTNGSHVLDGSGARSSGGTYINVSAAGQPGGIESSAGAPWANQAGFLNTFCLKPALDTDRDGLANEADPDNDNDGLGDDAERMGSAFSPITVTDMNAVDSDNDGQSDGKEAACGTDPLDPSMLLKLVDIRKRGTAMDISWVARAGITYRVLTAKTPAEGFTNVLDTVTAVGPAPAPWYMVTNTFMDAAPPDARFYVIEVRP